MANANIKRATPVKRTTVSTEHVSHRLKEAALRNIQRKHAVIKHYLREGVPQKRDARGKSIPDPHGGKVLEYFPTSLRQFAAWKDDDFSPAVLERLRNRFVESEDPPGNPFIKVFGNGTLEQHEVLKKEIVRDIKALAKKAEAQRLAADSTATIAMLRAELEAEQVARQKAEAKIAELSEKLQAALADVKKEWNGRQGDREGHQLVVDGLRKQIADLTAAFNNVAGIRPAADAQIPCANDGVDGGPHA